MADEATPILLVDARSGVGRNCWVLREARPDVRLVVLVDSNAAMRSPVVTVRSSRSRPTETVRACLVNLLETPAVRREGNAGRGEPGLRRLQRVFGDLKSGLASATVALNLMQLVSESYERAVIFLVKRDRLAPLGAFGFAENGGPLANAVRRLGSRRADFCRRRWRRWYGPRAFATPICGALAAILGSPANDQVVIFPVAGSERVIAAVYADNGDNPRPLRDVELLEVAAEQVGIAFENELLRRQLGR
jgi:hypothetical protein